MVSKLSDRRNRTKRRTERRLAPTRLSRPRTRPLEGQGAARPYSLKDWPRRGRQLEMNSVLELPESSKNLRRPKVATRCCIILISLKPQYAHSHAFSYLEGAPYLVLLPHQPSCRRLVLEGVKHNSNVKIWRGLLEERKPREAVAQSEDRRAGAYPYIPTVPA